jgi:diguanylate cyclase (GGDEF)-like protein
MDLDELKLINDRHGHFFGDRVLRGVGEVIRAGGRKIDTAARYGGDEFVVLLPETDPTGAYVLAEKIRLGVADLRVDVAGTEIQPSVSIGVVSFPDDGRTSDELMITADSSMYHSKRAGKNRVTGVPVMAPAEPGPEPGGAPPVEDVNEFPRARPRATRPPGRPTADIVANLEADLESRSASGRRSRGGADKSV